jgi:sarcosine oxidase gamma subunit
MSVTQPQAPSARRSPLGDRSVRANAQLRLEDLSWRARFGCKGPGAPSWLAELGLSVPREPNSAALDQRGILVARLATSEFLIEAVDGGFEQIEAAAHTLQRSAPPPQVYPVARQDLALSIDGPGSNTLLRQICSVDFAPLLQHSRADSGPIVLTSMIGVGVVAWPRLGPRGAALTLWIDPSFAHYFYTTLLEVGSGVGGDFHPTE